ncbi:MAG: hypothetical protein OT477_05245 [Chloroflexi bacterium]|nr:hypothetical protein [Chloroflexota bacterium]
MERLLGFLASFIFGLLFYGPWILVRTGWYKIWYLAPALPPLIWGRAVYGWPLGAMFVLGPFLSLVPMTRDLRTEVLGYIVLVSMIVTVWMLIWTPAWAKPFWQRYLESTYSYAEISGVFLPVWRQMDRREWSKKMETQEGIEELVAYARKGHLFP